METKNLVNTRIALSSLQLATRMKALLLNTPAAAHVNATLPLVRGLVTRGDEVVYVCGEAYRPAIEGAGARFVPCTTEAWDAVARPPDPRMITLHFYDCLLSYALEVGPAMEALIRDEAPDYILCDAMCLWGLLLARKLELPTMRLFPGYAMSVAFNPWSADAEVSLGEHPARAAEIAERTRSVADTLGVPRFDLREFFSHPEPDNLVFLARAFHPKAETFGPEYVFAGPQMQGGTAADDFPVERLEGERPLLYVTLGTVYNRWPEFFAACFEAFAGSPWQVVVSLGRPGALADLGPVPGNFIVRDYVPQQLVLEKARVFLTNGGLGSTMQALQLGVPMVVVPCMPEHDITAARVVELGVGVALSRFEVRPDTLHRAVEEVDRGGFRWTAEALSPALREDGPERAIEHVSAWARRPR